MPIEMGVKYESDLHNNTFGKFYIDFFYPQCFGSSEFDSLFWTQDLEQNQIPL